jgi:lysozyme
MRQRLLTLAGAVAAALFATALLADPAYAADPTGRYPVDGVDVASWQHPNGAPIDWAAVRAAGVNFATVKATEGSGYTNPYFRGDFTGAKARGLPVAPYHFYLGRNPNTGGAQADYFIAALRAAGYTGRHANELPPILDFEWDWKGGCPPYGSVADAKAWLDKVRAAFGRTPIIYTNRYFITGCLGGTTALGSYPLQIADYSSADRPNLPPGWSTWLMWQYTARSCVSGVPTCNLTRSVYNGGLTGLRRLANR